MNSIAVLMSTYNGEKYLREQLDSLLNQKGVISDIFVRDDGSCDETKNILREYEEKHSNIHLFFGKNIGVGNSFMNLIYTAPDDYDYYALSDQDDIWMENKLAKAVEMLETSGKFLYASNQECVDKNGRSIGLRYKDDEYIHLTPYSIMSENMLAGCTMVFNNEFFRLISQESNRPSVALLKNRIHDVWLAMCASLFESIVYDKNAYIKYRQHENNVVGAKEGFLKKVKNRFKKISHSEFRNGRSMLAKEVCAYYPEISEQYPLLSCCAKSRKFRCKREILKNHKELRFYTKERYLSFLFKVMFGLF